MMHGDWTAAVIIWASTLILCGGWILGELLCWIAGRLLRRKEVPSEFDT